MAAVKGAAVRGGRLSAVVPPLEHEVDKARLRCYSAQGMNSRLGLCIEPTHEAAIDAQPHF